MKEFIKKVVLFSIVVIVIFVVLGYFLEYQFNKNRSNKFVWQSEFEYDQFDYAFLGSSRTKNMIDISLIDSIYNTRGICLGEGGTDSRVLFMILYSFLKIQNNQLDKIYIQIDPFMLYLDSVYNKPNYDHYFFSKSNDQTIYNCLENKKYLWAYKMFPIVKYVEFNNVYNLTNFIRSYSKSSKFDKTKGSKLIEQHILFKPKYPKSKKYHDINKHDLHYLDLIMELCVEENIKIVLYTAPIFSYEKYYLPLYPNYDAEIMKITETYGLDYFDFADIYNENQKYFTDMLHLNSKGAKAFSKLMMHKTFDDLEPNFSYNYNN